MAKRAVGEKTSTINRSTASPARGLTDYCPDLDQRPRSWMGLEKDLPPGEKGKRPPCFVGLCRLAFGKAFGQPLGNVGVEDWFWPALTRGPRDGEWHAKALFDHNRLLS
jgi:hypothetical protein